VYKAFADKELTVPVAGSATSFSMGFFALRKLRFQGPVWILYGLTQRVAANAMSDEGREAIVVIALAFMAMLGLSILLYYCKRNDEGGYEALEAKAQSKETELVEINLDED